MGIPYSREINSAFEQVTPLVAAAYEVLQTTKNISLLLAGIQVLTVVLLGFIWLAIIGLIFTVSPDLEKERRELITPVMKWLASWIYSYGGVVSWVLRVTVVLITGGLGLLLYQGSISGSSVPGRSKEGSVDPEGDADKEEKA